VKELAELETQQFTYAKVPNGCAKDGSNFIGMGATAF